MKRILLGITGVIMLAFVAILFVNAGENTPVVHNPQTEVKMDAAIGSCMMQCINKKDTKGQSCHPSNCKGTNCDPEKCKNAGCDHFNSIGNCAKACPEVKSCDPAKCTRHTKDLVVK